MKNNILSPFYSIKNNNLIYLNEYKICKLPIDEEIKQKILKDEGVLLTQINKSKADDTILVLEPHPDDFALSALGYSLDRFNVTVLNIFPKTSLNYFTWKDHIKINEETYEKIRLKESELSIEKILKQHFISLKEKSMRITNKSYDEIERIILENTKRILKEKAIIKTILVPMGIGNHPDHIVVHDTIMKAYDKDDNFKIILYPEYPYARCRKAYNDRLDKIKNKYKIKPVVIDMELKIDIVADAISAYRSQFDDMNRNQMLSIIREDYRAIAQEYEQNDLSSVYYEVEGVKK